MEKISRFIACPTCKGDLKQLSEKQLECESCKRDYIIKNGRPYLLDDESIENINRFWGGDNTGNQINESNEDGIKAKLTRLWRKIPEPYTPMYSINKRIAGIAKAWKSALKENNIPDALIVGTFMPAKRKKRADYYSVIDCYKDAIKFDITNEKDPDIVGDGHKMPFKDCSFDIVVAQATMKHLMNPFTFISEVRRILKPGGIFYCEIAYMLAYHRWPGDYIRFTPAGVKELLSGFEIIEDGYTRGPSHAVVEIVAIYISSILSFNNYRIYSLLMKVVSWLLVPIKYLDIFMENNKWADYLGQVNFCICKKK